MPTGRQEPTHQWSASYSRTEGTFAAALADAYGLPPHEWQRLVLNDWLALDDSGRLLNSLCVLAVPRQNGKTGVCDPRETWGLVYRGEQILHTAQEFQTSQKAFNRLREKFGACKDDPYAKHPELNALVERYTTSANQMVLDLKNGGHIEFRTRGSNADMGRGGTFDLVVVDEAQAYTDEQNAALEPLNSAAPSGSPQTILMGTVPDPVRPHKGEVFADIRSRMHGSPRRGQCIHEWSVGEVGDVSDKARWYEANPSLGLQLLEAGLEKDLHAMSPEKFAMEHLGYWPELVRAAKPVITAAEWARCATTKPAQGGILAYAVKFPPDSSSVAVAVCRKPKEGTPHIEAIRHASLSGGIGWLVDFLAERGERAAQIVIDGQSSAQTLYDRLVGRVPAKVLIRPSSRDVSAACAWLLNAVREEGITHYDQPALNASATRTTRRRIGNAGGWGFDTTEDGDATLVEACALAYWAAMTTRRVPGRKAVIRW